MDYVFIIDNDNNEYCYEECNSSDSYSEDRYYKVALLLNNKYSKSIIVKIIPVSEYAETIKFYEKRYKYNTLLFENLRCWYNKNKGERDEYIM